MSNEEEHATLLSRNIADAIIAVSYRDMIACNGWFSLSRYTSLITFLTELLGDFCFQFFENFGCRRETDYFVVYFSGHCPEETLATSIATETTCYTDEHFASLKAKNIDN